MDVVGWVGGLTTGLTGVVGLGLPVGPGVAPGVAPLGETPSVTAPLPTVPVVAPAPVELVAPAPVVPPGLPVPVAAAPAYTNEHCKSPANARLTTEICNLLDFIMMTPYRE
jgi:hypothetical protein